MARTVPTLATPGDAIPSNGLPLRIVSQSVRLLGDPSARVFE